jgi:hypothetical protein
MQFGDAELESLTSLLNDLLNSVLEPVGIALFTRESAELAAENAIIGVVDVTIQDVTGPVTIFPLAHQVGDCAEGVQVFALEQFNGFPLGNAFPGSDLIVKVPQRAALDKALHAIEIPEDLPIDKAVQQINLLGLTKEERWSFDRTSPKVSGEEVKVF